MTRDCLAHRAAQIFAFVFLFVHPCLARQKMSDAEKLLFDSANRERASRELPLLKWDERLARAARKHAELMAEQNVLLHRLPGEADLPVRAREEGVSFSHITENIGMAVYANGFHDGWMHSPGHRANILDAASDSVGIAVVEGGEELFAVEDFARVVTLLSIEEQEKRIGKLIAARGLRLLDVGKDARNSCVLDSEFTGISKPHYIAHYETPDISQLPEGLKKELQSGRYKAAAVGACPPKKSSGSAPFRIVVMLY
jgi:Cysteine-rich secretory protein family